MSNWYGADDAWPRHSEDWWRDALRAAQAGGWSLEKFAGTSAHRWGKLWCSKGDAAGAGSCKINVDGSGAGAENVARDVPKRVRKCPHADPDGPSPVARVVRARGRLEGAGRLLDAVEAVLDGQQGLGRAWELLDAFDEAVEDVEAALESVGNLEAAAADARDGALHELRRLTDKEDAEPTTGLAEAGGRLEDAEDELDGLPNKLSGVRAARAQLVRLGSRAAALRDRVGP